MPTTSEIREQFLSYFESKNHRRVASSSLVPAGDPTLLFTNAGMNQFKDVFLGREKRDYARAVSSQKCVRAGGKHNDLENVGRTARHHTFFEMLGNFSFGDYFKKDAIEFAWELITKVYGLDPERLWFSVFEGDDQVGPDDEAAALWEQVGAPKERILRFGRKDNFWQMGETGPCGPCSEIHYYRGEDLSKNVASLVNGEGDDTMEIWNLVFMQYDRDASGVLTPLPAPSVDTGAGLERMATILQGVDSNYDIDLFEPVIAAIEKKSGYRYGKSFDSELDTAVRVLCDHARATTFLIADGVIPSNEGRGYVLRRIIRRAIRFGRKLPTPVVLTDLVVAVIRAMEDAYPELDGRRKQVMQLLSSEEERFANTLNVGMERIGQALDDVRRRGERTLGGEEVFRLYDTYGIPVDLIAELGEEEGVHVDREGYEEMMKAARQRAKAASKFGIDQAPEILAKERFEKRTSTFVGYDQLETPSIVKSILHNGGPVHEIPAGTTGAWVVVDPTPFYAESGGQVGDAGTLIWGGGTAVVVDTKKITEFTISIVDVEQGSLKVGQKVTAVVPRDVRLDTTANHTATHLLHRALKDVLGETVQQAGSLVAPDRLRFDYTWSRPLSEDETREVERMVNDAIRRNLEVTKTVMPIEEAKKSGAVSMFGEKYGEKVRIVSAGDFSSEFCGGCHVNRTGDIGLLKIVSDRSLAAGVRRMEAFTGRGALAYLQSLETTAREAAAHFNVPVAEVPAMVRALQERQKQLEKELKQMRVQLASAGSGTAAAEEQPIDVDGVRLLTRQVRDVSGGDLRNLADTLRQKLKSGVVLIGSESDGKATLLAAVTIDVQERVPANGLIQRLAPIVGGKGGGKPDLAQAGGKDPGRIGEALAQAEAAVREMLDR